jgi:hypothetical protein
MTEKLGGTEVLKTLHWPRSEACFVGDCISQSIRFVNDVLIP